MRRLSDRALPLVRPHTSRLHERLRYLYRDMDPAGVEIGFGALVLGFSLHLLWPHDAPDVTPRPPWVWGVLAVVAGLLQIAGALYQRRPWRIPGHILGAGFWTGFLVVYGIASPDPTWVVYMVPLAACAWSLKRVVTP